MSDFKSSAKSAAPKEQGGPAVAVDQGGEGRHICATGDEDIEKMDAKAVLEFFAAAHLEPSDVSMEDEKKFICATGNEDIKQKEAKSPPEVFDTNLEPSNICTKDDKNFVSQTIKKRSPKEMTKDSSRPEVYSEGEPVLPRPQHGDRFTKKGTVASDSDSLSAECTLPDVEREEAREPRSHSPSADFHPEEEAARPEILPRDNAPMGPSSRQESMGLPVATRVSIGSATMLTPAKNEEEGCCLLTLPCCDCQALVPQIRKERRLPALAILITIVLVIIMVTLAGTGVIRIDRRIRVCEIQKLLPDEGSNTSGALFGSDIDMDGDILVISSVLSPLRRCAYVFALATNATNATWEPQAKLVPADLDARAARDEKHSVSVDGNTIVLGLSGEYDKPYNFSGSVFVFARNGTDWKQEARLQPENGTEPHDAFGYSVAVSKDTIVVGAHKKDDKRGCVYVFAQENGAWTQQQKIQPIDSKGDDEFGYDVDIKGNTIAIGARDDDIDENGKNSGSVYIFTRTGLNWTLQDKLIPPDGDGNDFFGNAVSLDKDENTAIIGCYSDQDDENDRDRGYRTGSAYVFTKEGAKWTQQGPKLLSSDGKTGDRFGVSVDIDGDRAIIGASHNPGNDVDIGSAYIFERMGGKWTEQRKIVPSGGTANDYFGQAVAIAGDGDVIFVASPGDDDRGQDSGSAYLLNPC